jgi:hypothetical protein
MITFHMDADRALMSMGRLIHWANVEVRGVTEEVAIEGKYYAKSIAPRHTGALIQAIDTKPGRSGKSTEFMVVSRTPKPQKDIMGRPSKRMVPYQMYIHRGLRGMYKGGKKTGDHNYMQTTALYLAKKFPDTLMKSLKKRKK